MAFPSFGLAGFDQSMIFDLTELLANEECLQSLNPDSLIKHEDALEPNERRDLSPTGLPIPQRRQMDYDDSNGYPSYPSFIRQDPNLMWPRVNDQKVKIEDMEQNLKIFPIEEDDSIQMMDSDFNNEPTLSLLNNVMLSDLDLEEFLLPQDLPGLEKYDPSDPNCYSLPQTKNGETLFSTELRFQNNATLGGLDFVSKFDTDFGFPRRDSVSGERQLNRNFSELNSVPEKPIQRHNSVGSLQQALQQHSLNTQSVSGQGQTLLSTALNYGGREASNRKRTLESNPDVLLSSSPKLSLLNPPSPGMPYRRSPGHEASPHSPLGLPPASSSRNQNSSTRYRQRANTLHGFISPRSSTHSPSPGPSRTGRISSPGPSKMTQPPIAISSPSSAQSRLSSSAPTHTGFDMIWQRREPRQHLLSTSSIAGDFNSVSSLSGSVLSPTSFDVSHDEGFDSDDDSDLENYDDRESGTDCESDGEGNKTTTGGKKERYFWQYNVQSKGPKGRKVIVHTEILDPHILDSVKDPVFDVNIEGVKHSGKARRGDGNDLTPSPRKLGNIGKELDKLNRLINEMTPVSELPAAVRPDTRKEKNKLASRVCRLKKKAQHEANKLKLYGLQQEHKKMMSLIEQVKHLLASKYESDICRTLGTEAESLELTTKIDSLAKHGIKHKIAGNTADYVNRVIDRVYSGDPTGGVDDI